MLFLSRLQSLPIDISRKIFLSIVQVDVGYMFVCFGPGSAENSGPLRPRAANNHRHTIVGLRNVY